MDVLMWRNKVLGFFSYWFLVVAVLMWHEATEIIVRASQKPQLEAVFILSHCLLRV